MAKQKKLTHKIHGIKVTMISGGDELPTGHVKVLDDTFEIGTVQRTGGSKAEYRYQAVLDGETVGDAEKTRTKAVKSLVAAYLDPEAAEAALVEAAEKVAQKADAKPKGKAKAKKAKAKKEKPEPKAKAKKAKAKAKPKKTKKKAKMAQEPDLEFLDANGLEGRRIGVFRAYLRPEETHPDILDHLADKRRVRLRGRRLIHGLPEQTSAAGDLAPSTTSYAGAHFQAFARRLL